MILANNKVAVLAECPITVDLETLLLEENGKVNKIYQSHFYFRMFCF